MKLDAAMLRFAIATTFQHWATHPAPSGLPPPANRWTDPAARMAATNGLAWPTLREIDAATRAYLDPVLCGDLDATWNAGEWRWGLGHRLERHFPPGLRGTAGHLRAGDHRTRPGSIRGRDRR